MIKSSVICRFIDTINFPKLRQQLQSSAEEMNHKLKESFIKRLNGTAK